MRYVEKMKFQKCKFTVVDLIGEKIHHLDCLFLANTEDGYVLYLEEDDEYEYFDESKIQYHELFTSEELSTRIISD